MQQELSVPHASLQVSVRRCIEADLEPLLDRLDVILQGDYFFRAKHMAGILARPHNAVWAVMVQGEFAGVVIIYKQSTLHNLYISNSHRGQGVGTALLKFFQPEVIRSKGNMRMGDPGPFYQENGYVATGADPTKNHIVTMSKPKNPAQAEQLSRARAKAAANKAAKKLADDRQRLIDMGLTPEQVDAALAKGAAAAAAKQQQVAEPALTPLPPPSCVPPQVEASPASPPPTGPLPFPPPSPPGDWRFSD